MPRFIQNNPMAGVGNAERLALMKAQFDIDKAKQPTAVDRLSQFGQEIINYQADKAKVQVMAQQKQQQAEAQRREQVLDMKFKAGAPLEDKELIDLGFKDPAKGREWMAQRAADKQAKEWALKSNVAVNPATGKREYFTINPDPKIMDPKDRYQWSGIVAEDKYAASRERADMQRGRDMVKMMFTGGVISDVDILTNKAVINQKKLAAQVKKTTDPIVLYWLKGMQNGTYNVKDLDEGQGIPLPAGEEGEEGSYQGKPIIFRNGGWSYKNE